MSTPLAHALLEELLALDDAALAPLAERMTPLLADRLRDRDVDDEWLDAKRAAAYLGITPNALHKRSAAREIPFEQDGAGAKLWFKRSDLDRWRRGGLAR